MCQTNGRADFYLKIIGILVVLVVSILTYFTSTAITRNDDSHKEIKEMILTMSAATNRRVADLNERMSVSLQNAPPPHIHLKNGQVSRVLDR